MNKLIAAAKTDSALEVEGVNLKFTVDGAQFFPVKLRRAGASNPLFMKVQEEVLRDYRMGGVPLDKIEPVKQRELTRLIYARAIVAGWDEDAFGVPCNEANIIETMTASTDFQDWCVTQAQNAEHFRVKAIKEASGN